MDYEGFTNKIDEALLQNDVEMGRILGIELQPVGLDDALVAPENWGERVEL